jgi:hypothetical protein
MFWPTASDAYYCLQIASLKGGEVEWKDPEKPDVVRVALADAVNELWILRSRYDEVMDGYYVGACRKLLDLAVQEPLPSPSLCDRIHRLVGGALNFWFPGATVEGKLQLIAADVATAESCKAPLRCPSSPSALLYPRQWGGDVVVLSLKSHAD